MGSRYNDEPARDGGKPSLEEVEGLLNTISTPPVFADVLFKMIDEVSDDIISWSVAGDSVIIKEASKCRERETDSQTDSGAHMPWRRRLWGFSSLRRGAPSMFFFFLPSRRSNTKADAKVFSSRCLETDARCFRAVQALNSIVWSLGYPTF